MTHNQLTRRQDVVG